MCVSDSLGLFTMSLLLRPISAISRSRSGYTTVKSDWGLYSFSFSVRWTYPFRKILSIVVRVYKTSSLLDRRIFLSFLRRHRFPCTRHLSVSFSPVSSFDFGLKHVGKSGDSVEIENEILPFGDLLELVSSLLE